MFSGNQPIFRFSVPEILMDNVLIFAEGGRYKIRELLIVVDCRVTGTECQITASPHRLGDSIGDRLNFFHHRFSGLL